jgi:hypothetical protein
VLFFLSISMYAMNCCGLLIETSDRKVMPLSLFIPFKFSFKVSFYIFFFINFTTLATEQRGNTKLSQ